MYLCTPPLEVLWLSVKRVKGEGGWLCGDTAHCSSPSSHLSLLPRLPLSRYGLTTSVSSHHSLLLTFSGFPLHLESNPKGLCLADKDPHDSGSFANPLLGDSTLNNLTPTSRPLPVFKGTIPMITLGLPSAHFLSEGSRDCNLSPFRPGSKAHFILEVPTPPPPVPLSWVSLHPCALPLLCCLLPLSHMAPVVCVCLFCTCLMNASPSQQTESSREAKLVLF